MVSKNIKKHRRHSTKSSGGIFQYLNNIILFVPNYLKIIKKMYVDFTGMFHVDEKNKKKRSKFYKKLAQYKSRILQKSVSKKQKLFIHPLISTNMKNQKYFETNNLTDEHNLNINICNAQNNKSTNKHQNDEVDDDQFISYIDINNSTTINNERNSAISDRHNINNLTGYFSNNKSLTIKNFYNSGNSNKGPTDSLFNKQFLTDHVDFKSVYFDSKISTQYKDIWTIKKINDHKNNRLFLDNSNQINTLNDKKINENLKLLSNTDPIKIYNLVLRNKLNVFNHIRDNMSGILKQDQQDGDDIQLIDICHSLDKGNEGEYRNKPNEINHKIQNNILNRSNFNSRTNFHTIISTDDLIVTDKYTSNSRLFDNSINIPSTDVGIIENTISKCDSDDVLLPKNDHNINNYYVNTAMVMDSNIEELINRYKFSDPLQSDYPSIIPTLSNYTYNFSDPIKYF